MAYAYRPGLAFGGVPADVAGKELERIRKANKQLTAKLVIEAAEPQNAPLHDAFEWDDTKAANSFRESTARNLIRSVHIVREKNNRSPMYVHVRRERREDNSYEPVSVVVTKADMLASAVEELQETMVAAADSVITVLDLTRKAADKQRSKKVVTAKGRIEQAKRAVMAI